MWILHRNHILCRSEGKQVQSFWGKKSLAISTKPDMCCIPCPRTPMYKPLKNKYICSTKVIYKNVQASLIAIAKLETTQLFIFSRRAILWNVYSINHYCNPTLWLQSIKMCPWKHVPTISEHHFNHSTTKNKPR